MNLIHEHTTHDKELRGMNLLLKAILVIGNLIHEHITHDKELRGMNILLKAILVIRKNSSRKE